jgi:hypothetical protein
LGILAPHDIEYPVQAFLEEYLVQEGMLYPPITTTSFVMGKGEGTRGWKKGRRQKEKKKSAWAERKERVAEYQKRVPVGLPIEILKVQTSENEETGEVTTWVRLQVKPTTQRNGQLMGSILSFPILCLANLGLYLSANEISLRDPETRREKLKKVLVNGDDMLYVATEKAFKRHAVVGERIGLVMSPGKAYWHRRYANVNSVSADFDFNNQGSPFKIPFLNVGLLVGRHKVLGTTESEDDLDLIEGFPFSSVVDTLLEGALPGKEVDILKIYLSWHRKSITRELKGRNLFLPTSVGGLGQHAPEGFTYRVTREQLRIAHAILADRPYLVSAQRPLPSGRYLRVTQGPVDLRPFTEPIPSGDRARMRRGLFIKNADLNYGFVPYQFGEFKKEFPKPVWRESHEVGVRVEDEESESEPGDESESDEDEYDSDGNNRSYQSSSLEDSEEVY